MPDRAVYKSRAAEFLDGLFGGEPDELRGVYAHVLGNLESAKHEGLLQTTERLVESGELAGNIGVEHFERHWLSDSGPMAGQDVARVMLGAYQEAIRIASSRDDPLPIETFWVRGASDNFEVHICESERQVTVTLFVQTDYTYGSERAKSNSWIVRVAREGEDDASALDDEGPPVVAIQTSGRRSSNAG